MLRVRADRLSSAVDTQLQFNELAILLQRTRRLNQSMLCSVNKLLIRRLIRRHLFEELSLYDSRAMSFIANYREFEARTATIVSKFWRLIEERYVVHASAPGPACCQLMGRIFTCYLVNRISLQFFVNEAPAVAARIQDVFQRDKWHIMQAYSKDGPTLMNGIRVLEMAVEVLSHSIAMSTFSQTFHYILRTVEILVATWPKDSLKEMPRVIAWVVTHSDIEKLMQCYYFVAHFFPDGSKLFDIVGGLDVASWEVFRQFFLIMQQFATREKNLMSTRPEFRPVGAARAPS
jgi:hypothetical protein